LGKRYGICGMRSTEGVVTSMLNEQRLTAGRCPPQYRVRSFIQSGPISTPRGRSQITSEQFTPRCHIHGSDDTATTTCLVSRACIIVDYGSVSVRLPQAGIPSKRLDRSSVCFMTESACTWLILHCVTREFDFLQIPGYFHLQPCSKL